MDSVITEPGSVEPTGEMLTTVPGVETDSVVVVATSNPAA